MNPFFYSEEAGVENSKPSINQSTSEKGRLTVVLVKLVK